MNSRFEDQISLFRGGKSVCVSKEMRSRRFFDNPLEFSPLADRARISLSLASNLSKIPPCCRLMPAANYEFLSLSVSWQHPTGKTYKIRESLFLSKAKSLIDLAGRHQLGERIWLLLTAVCCISSPFYSSRAIMCYLVNKYGDDTTWSLYPRNPEARANVDKILFFDIGSLYRSIVDYFVSCPISDFPRRSRRCCVFATASFRNERTTLVCVQKDVTAFNRDVCYLLMPGRQSDADEAVVAGVAISSLCGGHLLLAAGPKNT